MRVVVVVVVIHQQILPTAKDTACDLRANNRY